MKTLETILIVFCIFLALYLFLRVFHWYARFLSFYRNFSGFFDELWETLEDLTDTLFSKFESRLKNVKVILLCLTFVVGIVILVAYHIYYDGADAFGEMIVDNTAIGAFINLTGSLFSPSTLLSFGSLVSIGLSSFLAGVYVSFTENTLEELPIPTWLEYILNFLFQVLLFFLAALLAAHTADWCETAGIFLADYFTSHLPTCITASHPLLMVAQFLGNLIVTLLLLAAAVLTFALIVREYLETLIFGFLNLVLMVVMVLIFQNWLHCPTYITSAITLLCLVAGEFFRNSDRMSQWYCDKIQWLHEHLP